MAATHTALVVDADGAVAFAAAHPGWYIFPGELTLDDDGKWLKRPLCRWTTEASPEPEKIRLLWEAVGGTAVVCVACAYSGIWVLDEDSDVPPGSDWDKILGAVRASKLTLVLRSSTKARPHYVFKQNPTDVDNWVREGKWEHGDVKASGMIVISAEDPIIDAPASLAPAGLLARLEKGRPKSRGRGLASEEEMWNWILETPEPEDLLLSTESGDRFLAVIIGRLHTAVEEGEHRRQACLNAVFQAAIEAMAGCYPAERAYTAIREAYEDLRSRDHGDKGWSKARQRDYDWMWAGLIPALRAGDHDLEAKVAEQRDRVYAEYAGDTDLEDEDELRALYEGIIARSGGGVPAPTHEEPSSTTPPVKAMVDEPTSSGAPGPETEASPPRADADGVPLDWSSAGVVTPEAAPAEEPTLAAALDTPPVLSDAALWGPHGDLIYAMAGRTESSAAGLLGALLAYSGVVLAGRAHFRVGVDIHGPNVYVMNIGASSAARKSSAMSLVDHVFLEPGWLVELCDAYTAALGCVPRKVSGMASGERMIHLWSPTVAKGDDGTEEVVWPGARVIMSESEASMVWKRVARDNSNLSEVFCKAWDQSELATHALTSGDASVPADRHLMGFIGSSTMHVTRETISTGDGTHAKSGFGNRFLWFYLPDSGVDLPFGADLPAKEILDYREALWAGVSTGAGHGTFGVEASWAPDAAELWAKRYGSLKRDKGAPGFVEGLCSRAESQVLRLALNYQLMANSAQSEVVVCKEALLAALAVWDYAKGSVEYLFGRLTGRTESDDLVAELESRGGWATLEELREDMNRSTLQRRILAGVADGWLTEGRISTGKSGRPPKAYAITARLPGRGGVPLAPASLGLRAGSARSEVPLTKVTWLTR